MADAEAFVATIKAGTGYDAPWLVVRGSTSAELNQRLVDAYSSVGDLVALDQVVKASFQGGANPPAGTTTQVAAQTAAESTTEPATTTQQAATTGGVERVQGKYATFTFGLPTAPQCVHGPMAQKEAVSKAGAPYKQWVCAVPARDYRNKTDCEAAWVN